MNQRPSLNELHAFAAIVRHASFRAAADELALSPSTLSHMMRGLEERLDLRLFHRTTRSVAPTEAGTRLFHHLAPVLSELDMALVDVGAYSKQPSGNLRINASDVAVRYLMQEIVPTFLERYPAMHLDLVTEGKLVDVVAEGFDAGVRLEESVPQDMVPVRFGGSGQFLTVASPAYLERFGTPTTPEELTRHRCVRFRLPSGKLYRWEFSKRHTQDVRLEVNGPVTLDHISLMVEAAIKGLGIAYVWHETARQAIAEGSLVQILQEWTPMIGGFCLYYPSHRLVPTNLRIFIDVLKEVEERHLALRN